MKKEVEIISGNLLDFPPHCKATGISTNINCIAHSCNTLNTMGAGIAKQIKERFPQAWEADCNAHETGKNKLGWYSEATFESMFLENKIGTIYNLYTQDNIGEGKQVSYDAFYDALSRLAQNLDDEDVLGLPYGISSGLAGGRYAVIKAIIDDIFCHTNKQAYIVKYDLSCEPRSNWTKSEFEYYV